MIELNAQAELAKWFSDHRPEFQARGFEAKLRLPDSSDVNKAVATLEGPSHVASITVWGNGMVEFVVLDVVSLRDAVIWDRECTDADQLHSLLDQCSESLSELTRQS